MCAFCFRLSLCHGTSVGSSWLLMPHARLRELILHISVLQNTWRAKGDAYSLVCSIQGHDLQIYPICSALSPFLTYCGERCGLRFSLVYLLTPALPFHLRLQSPLPVPIYQFSIQSCHQKSIGKSSL